VAGACECGNEPSGYVKWGEFLDMAEDLLASQEWLCSMAFGVRSNTKCEVSVVICRIS
jgi:hypothetical protein